MTAIYKLNQHTVLVYCVGSTLMLYGEFLQIWKDNGSPKFILINYTGYSGIFLVYCPTNQSVNIFAKGEELDIFIKYNKTQFKKHLNEYAQVLMIDEEFFAFIKLKA